MEREDERNQRTVMKGKGNSMERVGKMQILTGKDRSFFGNSTWISHREDSQRISHLEMVYSERKRPNKST